VSDGFNQPYLIGNNKIYSEGQVMLSFWQRSFYLIVFLFLTISVSAQSSTSRITGTVNDINGSAIEGATVTRTNEATGVTFTQVTTNDGVYAFTSLTAGRTKKLDSTATSFLSNGIWKTKGYRSAKRRKFY